MAGATYSFTTAHALELLGKVEMLVIERPGTTRIAMAERLGLEASTVGNYLKELHSREKIYLKRGESGKSNIVTWWPGVNPKPARRPKSRVSKAGSGQKQRIVNNWKPNTVQDPFALDRSFFRSAP